jgi:DNA-binding XRE family transcriptional regulator
MAGSISTGPSPAAVRLTAAIAGRRLWHLEADLREVLAENRRLHMYTEVDRLWTGAGETRGIAGLDVADESAAADEDARALSGLVADCVARRRDSGANQTVIAERMGTTQSAVSNLESGAIDPRLSTLQRYARAIGGRLVVTLGPETERDDQGAAT